MLDKLGATILSNEVDQVTAALSPAVGTRRIQRASRVSWHPKLLLLVALSALAFTATGLQAQPLASPSRLGDPVQRTQPTITCTTGRAALIGHAGRRAPTTDMLVVLGGTYVGFGGAIFALVASFRFSGNKMDSFFALLIPEPTGIQGLWPLPPDGDFSPFKFEQVQKPCAKLEASDFASGRPPEAANPPKISLPPAVEVLPLELLPRAKRTALPRSLRFAAVVDESEAPETHRKRAPARFFPAAKPCCRHHRSHAS